MAELPFNFDYWLMQKAEEGFEEARKNLMKAALTEIKNAKFENIYIQEFLIYAFKEIINEVSADKALLLKSRGKGQKTKSFKALKKGFEIAEAVFDKRLEKGKKKTLENCYQEVADKFGITTAKAKQLYMELKNYINEVYPVRPSWTLEGRFVRW